MDRDPALARFIRDVPVLSVRGATGLKGVNKLIGRGTSDPYCKVYWNGEEVGSTEVVSRNVNPRWAAEDFSLPGAGGARGLQLTFFDHETVGSHRFLGEYTMTSAEVKTSAEKRDPEREMMFPLAARVGNTKDKNITGNVDIAFDLKLDRGPTACAAIVYCGGDPLCKKVRKEIAKRDLMDLCTMFDVCPELSVLKDARLWRRGFENHETKKKGFLTLDEWGKRRGRKILRLSCARPQNLESDTPAHA